jgi:GDP-L-fucose synthase
MNKIKIIITGGSGLVGTALNTISKNYSKYEFIFMSHTDCDLTDIEQTRKYFNIHKPTYVIHLAANVGGLFKNQKYKVQMLEDNVQINMNVLKVAHELNIKKLVSCLSTCIFPDKTAYPINETMLHAGPPHFSNDAYAYAKRLLEIHSKAYREQYNDNFICVIPTNIYGPNDNYNLQNGHVIPSLIHKCYLAKASNSPFVIAGTGTPLRQFIYSEDVAKLLMFVLEEYQDGESIILSVNEKDEISIADVVKTIAKCYDYEHMIIFDSNMSDGQYRKTADNGKLMSIGWDFEFTSLAVGIGKSIDWFIENYDHCRK